MTASDRRLTTHVLDLTHGRPAAGMRIALYRIGGDGARVSVAETVTNADGRCDAPLLAGAEFAPGAYELVFQVGPYFAGLGVPGPAFLEEVPIRFTAAEGRQHYHVPLLVSPYGYSTYRGS